MWLFVKSQNGSKTVRINELSKLTKIEHLRELIAQNFEDATPDRQRLFFRGKQLEDGHTLFDYKVNINDVVQLFIRPLLSDAEKEKVALELKEPCVEEEKIEVTVDSSDYYKTGDFVDTCADCDGSWYDADIVKIVEDEKSADDFLLDDQGNALPTAHDGFKYYVKFVGSHPEKAPIACYFGDLRPRSWKLLKASDIAVGDTILANYNRDEPKKIGFWFDVVVASKNDSRIVKMEATLIRGSIKMETVKIHRVTEFFRIEKPEKLATRTKEQEYHLQRSAPPKRDVLPECSVCKDNLEKLCKTCGCKVCGEKDDLVKQILCDECNDSFHIYCLKPKLEAIPEDDWYCHDCRLDTSEVVQAGEKLKDSKKKAKMASQVNNSKRDWGKGMACQKRENVCSIVPPNHFGPIPGVEVGSAWRYRLQASAAGVHRPHVAGISGRGNEGAFSIVLSGGYDDDKDDGDEFEYTGSGGRDLTGNKRTSNQSCDQTLDKCNMALALCCNAPVSKKGGVAEDWRKGKPVRVIRKHTPHSEYSPKEGLRYDGIYKVVRYWPAKGKAGFVVWKYEFRRDDPTPAPWTEEGKLRIKTLGLTMKNPIGYAEKIAENSKTLKRASKDTHEEATAGKKQKSTDYKLPPDLVGMIRKDKRNKKVWAVCMKSVSGGQESFVDKVNKEFECVICQDVVLDPVTVECGHNMCKACIKRAVKAEMNTCPTCRQEFKKDFEVIVNEELSDALKSLLPGYQNGR